MKRRASVWLVVIVAALVVMAAPASATTGTKINTTDDDFDSAMLSDMSVLGTGTEANVSGDIGVSDTASSGSVDFAATSVDEEHGLVFSVSSSQGAVFVDTASTGSNDPTEAYLRYHSNGTLIEQQSIGTPGETMIFEHDFSPGVDYRVTVDDGGAVYTTNRYDKTTPYSSGPLTVEHGYDSTGQVSNPWAIVSVAIGDAFDLRYTGAAHDAEDVDIAFANITATGGGDVTVRAQEYDGSSWSTVNSTTISTAQNVSLNISTSTEDRFRIRVDAEETGVERTVTLADEGVTFDSFEPQLSNPDPADGASLSVYDGEISVDLNDTDFGKAQGDSVTVTAEDGNGDTIDTATVSSNQTISFLYDANAGANNITWIANSTYGQSDVLTQNFTAPSEFTIYNVSAPDTKVEPTTVTVRYFDGETIIENTTTDGTVPLPDNASTQTILVEARADGYHTRTTLIEGIFEQQAIYLLNTSFDSIEVRFTLQDRSGSFDDGETFVKIQRPLNRSGTIEWVTVAGDFFGVAGFTTDLQDGQRYRIIVKNGDGETRVLGQYEATVSETVPLTIGDVSAAPGDGEEEFTYSSTYTVNKTGSTDVIDFELNDTERETTEITLEIYEKGNESNVLAQQQTFADIYGVFTYTETVPSNQEDKEWVVNVTYERGGEKFTTKEIVGPRQPILSGMPGWLKALISVGSIWVVAGLFSQLNGDVGALVVAGMGGMFWFTDFLPNETGVGVVVLAMVTAGLIFINERRGV